MAKYAIVIFPSGDLTEIQSFREKFDPKAELIAPHMTLVFPFQMPVDDTILLHEIGEKLKKFSPFSVVLKGMYLDPEDNLLHLLVQNGAEKIRDLHDELYSGILEPYLRKDLLYTPHMTIGRGHQTAQAGDLYVSLRCDSVQIILIDDPKTPRILFADFKL